jgi:hypothetical protein
VQEATGVRYPIVMPALSCIAERSLVAPRFLTHNRQTIRGLYSLLSGDYPRLSLLTPKIYEYMRLPPESRRPCLPEILAREGYATAFLQAADPAYMSKDQFLPQAGSPPVRVRVEEFAVRTGEPGGQDGRRVLEGSAGMFAGDMDVQRRPGGEPAFRLHRLQVRSMEGQPPSTADRPPAPSSTAAGSSTPGPPARPFRLPPVAHAGGLYREASVAPPGAGCARSVATRPNRPSSTTPVPAKTTPSGSRCARIPARK